MSNHSTAQYIAHDTEWLRLANEVNKAQRNLESMFTTLMHVAGFKKSYNRNGGWYHKVDGRDERAHLDDALFILGTSPDTRNIQYSGRTHGEFLASWESYKALAAAAIQTWYEHEEAYTGWSRFFLVTTSNGHIHRTMGCSTCNKGLSATGFAMLPELSGTDAETAVKALGPALCSVCFPEAPVDWQDAEKVPATMAELLLTAGPEAFNAAMAKREAKRAAAGPKKRYRYDIVRGRRVRVEIKD